jgi:3' terminal RNA ribose 2'-O-methyltransferase Hen1
MLLTITTTHPPATDLGYLLHKHPGRCQSFPLSFGQAHVFYPEAEPERCTAALLLEVDPVRLVRGRGQGPPAEGFHLQQYVNDRPYVASSFLSVAIAEVYGTALAGRCRDRPELAQTALPLIAHLAVVPDPSGGTLLRRLFEPLGYRLNLQDYPLDKQFPAWGQSPYFSLELEATTRLADLLAHLYVLIPALDNQKHYWVGQAEVDKLLRQGQGWLAHHPERNLITRRYLRYKASLTRQALERLTAEETPDLETAEQAQAEAEAGLEKPLSLNEQRLNSVVAALKASGAGRVLDLGCGEGQLLRRLLADPSFTEIAGLDVSYRALERAKERLRLERLPARQQQRLKLWHGSLTYRDPRLAGFEAAAVVEVIEHLDPPRLAAFERVLFEQARPTTIVMTTPNAEYNVKFSGLPAGKFRHPDHRFEWTRASFQAWANQVAARFGYTVRFLPVGPEDPAVGSPTQMGVFVIS